MYEMRLGCDGTCPGAALSDVYVRIWDLYQSGQKTQALDLFGKLMLLVNTDGQIPGTFQYLMKRRGVFKTSGIQAAGHQAVPGSRPGNRIQL